MHTSWIAPKSSKHRESERGADDEEREPAGSSRGASSSSGVAGAPTRPRTRALNASASKGSPRSLARCAARSTSVASLTHPLRCAWSSTLGRARHAGTNARTRRSRGSRPASFTAASRTCATSFGTYPIPSFASLYACTIVFAALPASFQFRAAGESALEPASDDAVTSP